MYKQGLHQISANFDILRFIAIFSVVCAHSSVSLSNANNMIVNANRFLQISGTFGVPLFFFISGFFYISTFDMSFIVRKIKTVIIPWFFVETIVWLYVVLRKGGINFYSWLNFIIGNGHSTYYLTVLMILYLIYSRNRRSIFKIFIIVLLSLFSNYLTYLNLFTSINPFLNVFNWSIYFSLGLLVFQFRCFEKICAFSSKFLFVSILIFLSLIFFQIQNEISIYYWGKFALINNFLFIFVSIGISAKISDFDLFKKIGKESFSIYLMHELLVGTVIYLTELNPNWIIVIIRPLVVILILHFFMMLVKTCSRKYSNFGIFKDLLGIRE